MPESQTTALVEKGTDLSQEWKIDVGDVMWPASIIFVSLLVYKALKNRFFPGGSIAMGNMKASIGGEINPVDIAAIQVFSLLYDGKIDFKNAAWAEQCSYIDDVEEEFVSIMKEYGSDMWQLDAPWNRLKSILTSAADKNHIIHYVNQGEVDSLYLFDKVNSFKKKYNYILERPGSTLPEFELIKQDINGLVARTLSEFGRIADRQADRFREFKEKLSSTVKDPATRTAIEAVV